jgi:hypothetical protein
VNECELVSGGMTTFRVLDLLEQLEVAAQRPHHGDEPAHVFRMSPAGVVATAVGVRHKCGAASVVRVGGHGES